jgi:putative effector of murein hydrolase
VSVRESAWLVATFVIYEGLRVAYARWPRIYTLPVLGTTVILAATCLVAQVDLDRFAAGTRPLLWLLGPATVALAIPLVRERALLARHARAVLIGVAAGAVAALVTAVLAARALHLPALLVRSIAPKSVTTPVAMSIAARLGGSPEVAAGVVLVTGLFGMAFGPAVLTRAGVRSPLGRGLALGTTSHGIGTAAAMSEGAVTGAAAAVGMVLAAVVTALAAEPLVRLLE